jgi:tetratricopeptide (TPR) repeat protein
MSARTRSQWIPVAAAAALACAVPSAHAQWPYVPSAADWKAWPEVCRVQYAWVSLKVNEYGRYYSDADIQRWRSAVGPEAWTPLHHYCKALVVVREARRERNKQTRQFLVQTAISEAAFTYDRVNPSNVFYPALAATMAEARFLNGEIETAESILRRVIELHPKRFEPYAMLSNIYAEAKRDAEAIAVLEQADRAAEGQSAEIRYSLGLLNLKQGKIDAAVEHARVAYALGFPLEGLKNRLKKLGRWPPTPQALGNVGAPDSQPSTTPASTNAAPAPHDVRSAPSGSAPDSPASLPSKAPNQ